MPRANPSPSEQRHGSLKAAPFLNGKASGSTLWIYGKRATFLPFPHPLLLIAF